MTAQLLTALRWNGTRGDGSTERNCRQESAVENVIAISGFPRSTTTRRLPMPGSPMWCSGLSVRAGRDCGRCFSNSTGICRHRRRVVARPLPPIRASAMGGFAMAGARGSFDLTKLQTLTNAVKDAQTQWSAAGDQFVPFYGAADEDVDRARSRRCRSPSRVFYPRSIWIELRRSFNKFGRVFQVYVGGSQFPGRTSSLPVATTRRHVLLGTMIHITPWSGRAEPVHPTRRRRCSGCGRVQLQANDGQIATMSCPGAGFE